MSKGKIAWIVPPLQKGSGGLRTIFQNLNYASESGYENDIYFELGSHSTPEKLQKDLLDFYGKILAKNVYLGTDVQSKYDLIMATNWHTAEIVKNITCQRKAYFIQDYEPWFFPIGTNYLIAEQSYQLGFKPITIGRWLAKQIQNKSGQNVAYFDFCADLEIYHNTRATKKENAICCIYQPEKDRRCSELLLMALRMIKNDQPDLTIYLYGSDKKLDLDFEVTNLGIISPAECNELYNKCRLGVSMGSSNPSRIPFEMMVTGLPVVDLYRENNLYDLPDQAISLADPNPNALAFAVLDLLNNEDRRVQMSQAGIDFMQERPLEKGYRQFISALDDIFAGRSFRHDRQNPIYQKPAFHDPLAPQSPTSYDKYRAKLSQLSHVVIRRAQFAAGIIHPRNIKKAYQVFQKGGLKEFVRRFKSKLHYQYANQRYQYRDYLNIIRPTEKELAKQHETDFEAHPCFGVMIPLYNTKPEYLQDLLDSFKAQTYTDFKLFMVDASPATDGKTTLTDTMQAEAKKDPRIIYKVLDRNEGIAGNTNQAIRLAMKDNDITHIALCDHDDFIEPDAFYQYVKVLNEDKNIKIIYSDEDVVKFKDDPEAYYVMKPDFNPFLMESCNYINHFFVCEKDLLEKIKTNDDLYERPAYDGAQDYDLYLRLIEEALALDESLKKHEIAKIENACYTSSTIHHIPRVLYHWRAAENSTAQDPHNKLYAFEAGKHALESYYKRRQIPIKAVEHTDVYGTYRTKYRLPQEPLVSIIIPNKDHIKDLKKAIESVKNGNYKNLEFIIIENNSEKSETFSYYDEIQKNTNIKVVYFKGDYNYSAVNNFGVKYAKGEYLLLLNNDTQMIDPDSISEMVSILQRNKVGAVGAKLLFPDGKLQHAGVIVGFGHSAGHIFFRDLPAYSYGNRANCTSCYSAVTAACLMVKKSTYEQIKGFDEDLAIAFNDVDFCLKIRSLNKLVVYTPYAKFYHFESRSRTRDVSVAQRERLEKEARTLRHKWPELYAKGDPYYNRNLSLEYFDCRLRNLQQ